MLGVYCGRDRRGRTEQGHTILPVTLDPILAKVPGISEEERVGPAQLVSYSGQGPRLFVF